MSAFNVIILVASFLTFVGAQTSKEVKGGLMLDDNLDVDQLFGKFKAEHGTSFLLHITLYTCSDIVRVHIH